MMPQLSLGVLALFVILTRINQTPLADRTTVRPRRPAERGPGIFVPQRVLVALGCLVLSVAAGVLVWLIPTVWPPVDAALAVIGLSLALYALRRGQRRS